MRDELLTPFNEPARRGAGRILHHIVGDGLLSRHSAPGAWAATTEFKLNYLAPVTEGTVSASSQIVSLTKRTAVVRIEVTNGERRCAWRRARC